MVRYSEHCSPKRSPVPVPLRGNILATTECYIHSAFVASGEKYKTKLKMNCSYRFLLFQGQEWG